MRFLLSKAGLYILFIFFISIYKVSAGNILVEPGVHLQLAQFRKAYYEKIRYDLFFSIPEIKSEPVEGEVKISVQLKDRQPFIIDFRASASQLKFVKLNNEIIPYEFINDHIVIEKEKVSTGENHIYIGFVSNDQSLNRRDDFLYTLLVPDRARTLFPCFDQPALKALFTLKLEIPASWEAVSNSVAQQTYLSTDTQKKVWKFKETEPLSTYLFSFVAGKLDRIPFERNGREISVYHRETDVKKIAQCNEIARQVFDALEWLEVYTAIPYPFSKYDLIILPGFQYGGMEHTGATLYNDRRMFLDEEPTLNEQLNRSSLIAHETAHMWFGDYVTMEWFDDVWTKEIFANYFASKITEPMYPDVNHALNFMLDYYPSSYAEDRTEGTNPIKQPLDNLNNAGLVYGNIIYNKSPIVLDMLVRKMGEDSFKTGIREYLKTYAYRNATWENLVEILDKYTTEDLKEWSHIWVNEKGMPVIEIRLQKDSVVFSQSDPWGRGIEWAQEIAYTQISGLVVPNTDGKGYGFFKINEHIARQYINLLDTCQDEVLRASLHMILYENVLNGTISSNTYIPSMLKLLQYENNSLLFSMLLGNIVNCQRLYPVDINRIEKTFWTIIKENHVPQHRLQTFRRLYSLAESPEDLQCLYHIWKNQSPPENCSLSENDYINLSYVLAIRFPERADHIIKEQLSRIKNPDRVKEFLFISPSVSPRKEERDSVFNFLLIAENRRVEPWVSAALSYLNHLSRQKQSVAYIRPALDILREVQRTGDIFFPTFWVRSLLTGHTSIEAKKEIDRFFHDNPDYPVMLSNKIKQQADFLYRATEGK